MGKLLDRLYCDEHRVHPGGRVHAEHLDEVFQVPREMTLPKVLTVPSRTYTFPVIKREAEATLAAPIASIGRPETADYTVQQWAFKVWRVHSVHRCERCGEIVEVGSYLMVSVFTLEEQPLVVAVQPDGNISIE